MNTRHALLLLPLLAPIGCRPGPEPGKPAAPESAPVRPDYFVAGDGIPDVPAFDHATGEYLAVDVGVGLEFVEQKPDSRMKVVRPLEGPYKGRLIELVPEYLATERPQPAGK